MPCLFNSTSEQALGHCLRESGPPQHSRAPGLMALEGLLLVQRRGDGVQTGVRMERNEED